MIKWFKTTKSAAGYDLQCLYRGYGEVFHRLYFQISIVLCWLNAQSGHLVLSRHPSQTVSLSMPLGKYSKTNSIALGIGTPSAQAILRSVHDACILNSGVYATVVSPPFYAKKATENPGSL